MKTLDSHLIAEMKQTALENPHNPEANPMAPMVCHQEDVQYKGLVLNIMLTFDYFTPMTEQQAWHLSVSQTNHEPLSPEIQQEITRLAFTDRGEVTQLPPEAFPPELRFMRQFIQVLKDKKFDVENKRWCGKGNPTGTEKP